MKMSGDQPSLPHDDVAPRGRDRPAWVGSLAAGILTAAALVLVIGLVDLGGSASTKQAAINGVCYLVIALGIQTFMGSSGITSFGHVGFAAIGAYVASICTTAPELKATVVPNAPGFIQDVSMGFVAGTLVAAVFTAAVAAVVGVAVVRMKPSAAPLATLGLLIVISVIGVNLRTVTNGTQSFYGIPTSTTLWSGLGFACAAIIVARLFRDSRPGLSLRASRSDEVAARSAGVRVERVRLAAWMLSAAITAVGGSLYAHSLGAISPSIFVFDLTFIVLTIVIIGGQSTSAVVLAAVLMTAITQVTRNATSDAQLGSHDLSILTTLIPGLLVLLMLIWRPQGLLGRWEGDELIRDRLRSKRAQPHGGVTDAGLSA